MQTALRRMGDYVFFISVKKYAVGDTDQYEFTSEHYSDYFFHSILKELPDAFIVSEYSGKLLDM